MELTIDTYVKATMDVPPRWLEASIAKLIRSQGTGFLPTIGRVLQVVATEARAVHRRANGQDPTHGDRGPLKDVPEDRVDDYIGHVRAWEGLPAVATSTSSIIALPMEVEKRVRDFHETAIGAASVSSVRGITREKPNLDGAQSGRRPTTHDQPF